MTYNSKNVRSPIINFGGLTLTWTLGRATVSSSEGLSLECHLSQDLCRLSVTGEHFAATAGLLGVFDFDNNTDFMTSDWEMVRSALKLRLSGLMCHDLFSLLYNHCYVIYHFSNLL